MEDFETDSVGHGIAVLDHETGEQIAFFNVPEAVTAPAEGELVRLNALEDDDGNRHPTDDEELPESYRVDRRETQYTMFGESDDGRNALAAVVALWVEPNGESVPGSE